MTDLYRIRPADIRVQAREDYLADATAETVCRRHDLGLSASVAAPGNIAGGVWARRPARSIPPT